MPMDNHFMADNYRQDPKKIGYANAKARSSAISQIGQQIHGLAHKASQSLKYLYLTIVFRLWPANSGSGWVYMTSLMW